MSVSRVAGWCLVVVLSVLFFMTGLTKFTFPGWETRFEAWGYPSWLRMAVGTLELLCAVLLWVPRSRRWAAVVLVSIMAGAALTHGLHGETPRIVVNAVLACLLIGVMATDRSCTKNAQTFPGRHRMVSGKG